LLIALCHHMALGLRMVVEDYVHLLGEDPGRGDDSLRLFRARRGRHRRNPAHRF
jgi:hypothetical protein